MSDILNFNQFINESFKFNNTLIKGLKPGDRIIINYRNKL